MTIVIRTTGIQQFLTEEGESFLRVLILGQYAAGKTRSSSFWVRPLIISFEPDNLASIADRRVPYVVPHSQGDINDIIKRLEIECRKPVPDRKFQTVVVDTLDSAQEKVFIPAILQPQGKTALSGYGDYGELAARTMSFVNRLLALPMNVIVNVHIKQEDSEEEGVPTRYMPALDGSAREKLPKDFQLVGWMRARHVQKVKDGPWVIQREVRWEATRNFPILKDQFGRLPVTTPVNFNENDYLQLVEHIFGDYLDTLKESVVVEEVEQTVPDVVGPLEGGPVDHAAAKKAQAAAKKAAPAKKAATKTTSTPVTKAANPPAAKTATPAPEAVGSPQSAVTPGGGVVTTYPPAGPSKGLSEAAETPAPEPGDHAGTHQQPENGRSEGSDVNEANISPPTTKEAVQIVQDRLNGRVVDEAPVAEQSRQTTTAHKPLPCGTPSKRIGSAEPVPGCGRDLMQFDINQVNIALLKTKTYLCPDCFKSWRSTTATAKV